MSEQTPASKARPTSTIGIAGSELKDLYDQLAITACASAAAARIAKKQPSVSAFARCRELDQRVDSIIARINAILG